MVVFSENKFPPNITNIDESLASVVYRVDPPGIYESLDIIF